MPTSPSLVISSALLAAAAVAPIAGKLTAPIAIYGMDSTVVFNPW
jgi:hypothetical protein